MLFRRVSRFVARVLIVTGAVGSVMGGCTRQGEGERCDFESAGDSDCDEDLECVPCEQIQNSTVDRCCRRDLTYEDGRCARGSNGNTGLCDPPDDGEGTGGTGGSGAGTSGAAGEGGDGSSATSNAGTGG
jgi:hypothetical protein